MYSSITIANYFLLKAWDEETDLTPMQLLKLVYIAHGWYLGENGQSLIRDRIRAWTYGPVIPELYHHIKEYGKGPVTVRIQSAFRAVNNETIKELDAKFLDIIWEYYKKFSAFQLSGLTHQKDSPWDQVARNYSPKELSRSSVPIPNSIIKEYYEQRIEASNGRR